MSNTNSSKSGGIGFTGLLTIVFITAKVKALKASISEMRQRLAGVEVAA